jgi:hypothetical protein
LKKLLILTTFLSACLAGDVRDVYRAGASEIINSDFYIGVFTVACLAFTTTFIAIGRRKFHAPGVVKRGRQITFLEKIKCDYVQPSRTVGNLFERLDIAFAALHKKAAANNNKIVFCYGDYPKLFEADFENTAELLFTTLDFVLKVSQNAVIKLGARPITNEKYRFFICINQNLNERKQSILRVLDGKKANIDYAKLALVPRFFDALSTKLKFENAPKSAKFYFDVDMKPMGARPRYQIKNSKNPKIVVCEEDIVAFATLDKQLRSMGAQTIPKSSLALEHALSPVFIPNAVFINGKILRKMLATDLAAFIRAKREKNFCLIVLSDNAADDEYFSFVSREKCCYMLRQPYVIDELCAILNKTNAEKNGLTDNESALINGEFF